MNSSFAWAIQAQPVPIPESSSLNPQVNLSGVGITTGSLSRNLSGNQPEFGIDYRDTTVQIGVAQRLYDTNIGSMGFGMLASGGGGRSPLSPLFLSQSFVDYQGEQMEVLIGRTDNPTAHLVDFPTLRDDDLYSINNPLNPFTTGEVEQDHRYSNVFEVVLNQDLTYFENFHVQQLMNSSGSNGSSGVNSFGFTFQYLSTPGMERFPSFSSYGFGVEHLTPLGRASAGIYQFYGGGVLNLNHSVTDHWDFRFQDIVSLGSDLNLMTNSRDTFEADSHSISTALRYRASPFGRPGYQLALTVGYKNYFKVMNANTFGIALTGVKQLGEGLNAVAQYLGQWRDSALCAAQSLNVAFEQVAEVGFTFNWDATFNQHLSARRSILNQQYQYLPAR